MGSPTFIKLMRTAETLELIKHPNAWALYSLIAMRARWNSGFSAHGLEIGEALIGDLESCGLTRQQYRTSLNRLVDFGLITIIDRNRKGTRIGTIVKLNNSSIYDINADSANQSPTSLQPDSNQSPNSLQPDSNQSPTSPLNKKGEGDKGRKNKIFSPNSPEIELSKLLYSLIAKRTPDYTKPDFQKWAVHVDRMIRIDKKKPEKIREVIEYCQAHDFWRVTILSTRRLRKHINELQVKMENTRDANSERYRPRQPDPNAAYRNFIEKG